MKKTFLIFLLLFISCLSIYAQNLPPKKLNNRALKTFFLDNYGTNDTSRAVIEFYFLRKKELKTGIIVGGAIGLLSSYVLIGYKPPKVAYPDDYSGAVLGLIAIVGTGSALAAIGNGIIIRKYNSEHLLNILNTYQKDAVIPKWILRNPKFRRFLPRQKSRFFLFR